MSKLSCVLSLLAACLCASQAGALSLEPEPGSLAAAVRSRDWTAVHNILGEMQRKRFNWLPKDNVPLTPLASIDLKQLKPAPGGQVYGKAVSTYISSDDRDGRRVVTSGGHEVENVNGRVQERDFDPLSGVGQPAKHANTTD